MNGNPLKHPNLQPLQKCIHERKPPEIHRRWSSSSSSSSGSGSTSISRRRLRSPRRIPRTRRRRRRGLSACGGSTGCCGCVWTLRRQVKLSLYVRKCQNHKIPFLIEFPVTYYLDLDWDSGLHHRRMLNQDWTTQQRSWWGSANANDDVAEGVVGVA